MDFDHDHRWHQDQCPALCWLGTFSNGCSLRGGGCCACSVGEAFQYMQAKKLRPLIASEVEPVNIPGIGKVEPITNMSPDL